MPVSKFIKESMTKSSWIRKMFEEGIRLKKEFGAENVYDFSLGNPDLDPPEKFFETFKEFAGKKTKGAHGYMPNAGSVEARNAIAEKVSKDHEVKTSADQIVMTVGAAGGLNAVFKTILDPQDEVIIIKPYFVEYNFYVTNHGGVPVHVDSKADFSIDVDNIKKAVTGKTRAVLINSPNNPTGKIYHSKEIQALADLLKSESSARSKIIYLISDEPYREIVYNGAVVESIFKHYKNSIVVNSYSKSLSLPGERIGYIAASSSADGFDELMGGLILSNRILGFVNAPALMQRIVARLNESSVDVSVYKKRRDIFVSGLKEAGYDFTSPEGAFYIFCKSPGGNDIEFVQHLQKYNILVVPGTGFGAPGYFRIAYCVDDDIIKRSIPLFKEAISSYRK
jgi:aspartate aminotransferase